MWDEFRKDALELGGHPTRFVQSEWAQDTQSDLGGGPCMPLVCKWVDCRLQQANFAAVAQSQNGIRDIRRIAAEYNSATRAWDGESSDLILARRGFALDMIRVVGDQGWKRFLRDHIACMSGGYYVVGFQGDHDYSRNVISASHAVALDTHRHVFFEPNAGEATFGGNVRRLCDFVRFWLDEAYQLSTGPRLMIRRYVYNPDAIKGRAAPVALTWR